MRTRTLAVPLASLTLAACSTTFHGLRPLYPEMQASQLFPEVDGVQPTLRWEKAPEPDVTYDLVIHEGLKSVSAWKGPVRAVGKKVYYREGLNEPQHKLEEPLQPDREYYWSVRKRRGDKVTSWSSYDYESEWVLGSSWGQHQPYRFRTPPASSSPRETRGDGQL